MSVNNTTIGYFLHFLFPTFFLERFVNQLGGVMRDTRLDGVATNTMMCNAHMPDNDGATRVGPRTQP